MTPPAHPSLPRRTFLACAAAATAVTATGCSAGHATDTAPFTVPSTDIPVGGGKIFPDQATVITQPKPGEFHAFSTTCTHQGCTVSDIRNGLIVCPCHGSRFRITDGTPERGPAREPLTRRGTQTEGHNIHIN
ncbi:MULTISPECIES: Rieske (2Fe-2S) protein [Nocardia]|uniref:Rieske (2Fe-2S) protein n=1 Tax=Nocardia TaxID=1817 RepID=UPI0002E5B1CD|nr:MULTISPECIES: Rieske (2Fe-2S) protein [Nocardia]